LRFDFLPGVLATSPGHSDLFVLPGPLSRQGCTTTGVAGEAQGLFPLAFRGVQGDGGTVVVSTFGVSSAAKDVDNLSTAIWAWLSSQCSNSSGPGGGGPSMSCSLGIMLNDDARQLHAVLFPSVSMAGAEDVDSGVSLLSPMFGGSDGGVHMLCFFVFCEAMVQDMRLLVFCGVLGDGGIVVVSICVFSRTAKDVAEFATAV